MNRTFRTPALCALAPFLCTGIYGVIVGVQNPTAYLSETMYPVSTGSAIYTVFLGVLRGLLTLLCVALCARAVWVGRITLRHVIFPAVLACLYGLSLLDPPLTTAGILQACTAVLALANMVLLRILSKTGVRTAGA